MTSAGLAADRDLDAVIAAGDFTESNPALADLGEKFTRRTVLELEGDGCPLASAVPAHS